MLASTLESTNGAVEVTDVDGADGRVLLVEDDDELSDAVRLTLSYGGFEVSRAADGREALDRLSDELPDVIVLDVMMPGMDGWQVLRELKLDPRTRDIPVVMMTALAEEHDVIKGHLEGAVRYVTKPFDMHELNETIREALAPLSDTERAKRQETVKALLQRLAEIDAGRVGGDAMQVSRLEPLHRERRLPTTRAADREKGASLTPKQRHIARELAAGRSARELAEELGVSRSNVYATRKRIARKLGVRPDEVAAESRRLDIT
jgi:DNA-binding response OmpR family regulator